MRAGISAGPSASGEPIRVARELVLAAAVGLMAGLADVPVDLLPGIEALLLLGGQRRNRRRDARLARPLDARQHAARPRARARRLPPPAR